MAKIRIVALGDSITNGAGLSGVKEKETFRHLLQEELSRKTEHDIEVINAGVNGDITTTAIYRLETDVLHHSPDYVTIMFGVNDAGYYRPATNSAADTPRVTAERFRGNLEAIIAAVKESGAKPILVTPVPMNQSYGFRDLPAYIENGLNYIVDEYSDIIRDLSARFHLPLIDVYQAFSADSATDKFVPDGIHPNKDGHRFIADIFIEKFASLDEFHR